MNSTIPKTIKSMIRPIISIVFTIAIWVGFFMGKIDGNILLGIYGTIIGFWFGERSALNVPEGH